MSRRLKIVVTVLVCLINGYAAYRYVLHRAVEAKLDEIREQGYPVTLGELDKWYPQPPPGENAADVYSNAFAHFASWPTNELEMIPLEGKAKLPAGYEPLPEEMKKAISEYLADSRPALDLLQQASAMPQCRYPIDLTKGFNTPLSHLNKLRRGVRLLALYTVFQAENQRSDEAAGSVLTSLALARSLDREPMLISQLVRCACQAISLIALQRGLSRAEFDNGQLTRLSSSLFDAETSQQMSRTWVSERCLGNHAFEMILRSPVFRFPRPSGPAAEISPEELRDASKMLFGEELSTPGFIAGLFLYKSSGLLKRDQLEYLKIMNAFLGTTQMSVTQSLDASSIAAHQANSLPRYFILSHLLLGALDRVQVKEAQRIAQLRSARVALAVERYRIDNTKLPERLDELLPKYIDAIPIDPFDGKLLRFRRLDTGYVVYSVGEDREDNGGREKDAEGHSYKPGTDITFTVER